MSSSTQTDPVVREKDHNMKIILAIITTLCITGIKAEILENPKYAASTWHQINLSSIEITDSSTVFCIKMRTDYTYLSKVPPKAGKKKEPTSGCGAPQIYIEKEDQSERMNYIKIEERATEKKDGIDISEFRVYFPALPKDWHTINYIEPFHQIAGIIINEEKTENPTSINFKGHIDDWHPCFRNFAVLVLPVKIISQDHSVQEGQRHIMVSIQNGHFSTTLNVNNIDSITFSYMLYNKKIAVDINKDIEYYLPLGEKTEDPKRLKTLQEKGTQEKITYIPRM